MIKIPSRTDKQAITKLHACQYMLDDGESVSTVRMLFTGKPFDWCLENPESVGTPLTTENFAELGSLMANEFKDVSPLREPTEWDRMQRAHIPMTVEPSINHGWSMATRYQYSEERFINPGEPMEVDPGLTIPNINKPIEIKQLRFYRCRINMRSPYKGRTIKPECGPLQGKIVELQSMWLQDDEDNYPGEWAMGPYEVNGESAILLTKAIIPWISSGDLEILEEITRAT